MIWSFSWLLVLGDLHTKAEGGKEESDEAIWGGWDGLTLRQN